jgi:hypothetical protein
VLSIKLKAKEKNLKQSHNNAYLCHFLYLREYCSLNKMIVKNQAKFTNQGLPSLSGFMAFKVLENE